MELVGRGQRCLRPCLPYDVLATFSFYDPCELPANAADELRCISANSTLFGNCRRNFASGRRRMTIKINLKANLSGIVKRINLMWEHRVGESEIHSNEFIELFCAVNFTPRAAQQIANIKHHRLQHASTVYRAGRLTSVLGSCLIVSTSWLSPFLLHVAIENYLKTFLALEK